MMGNHCSLGYREVTKSVLLKGSGHCKNYNRSRENHSKLVLATVTVLYDSGYISKVEPCGFADGLGIGYEKEIQDDVPDVFALSNWKNVG